MTVRKVEKELIAGFGRNKINSFSQLPSCGRGIFDLRICLVLIGFDMKCQLIRLFSERDCISNRNYPYRIWFLFLYQVSEFLIGVTEN